MIIKLQRSQTSRLEKLQQVRMQKLERNPAISAMKQINHQASNKVYARITTPHNIIQDTKK